MGQGLAKTATELNCSERTLRRYVNTGLLRGRRLGPRYVELPLDEEDYARRHWPLLHTLRRSLRTERAVRLAVLYGSTATGEDEPASDVDVLVALKDNDPLSRLGLQKRISEALGRSAHLVELEDARRSPSLLSDVVTEGRVIVDRDELWPTLSREQESLVALGEVEDEETLAAARRAVSEARERLG